MEWVYRDERNEVFQLEAEGRPESTDYDEARHEHLRLETEPLVGSHVLAETFDVGESNVQQDDPPVPDLDGPMDVAFTGPANDLLTLMKGVEATPVGRSLSTFGEKTVVLKGGFYIKEILPEPTHSGECNTGCTSGRQPYICECGKQFAHASNLSRHRTSVHKGKRAKCPHCQKILKRSDYLKLHIKTCPMARKQEPG